MGERYYFLSFDLMKKNTITYLSNKEDQFLSQGQDRCIYLN